MLLILTQNLKLSGVIHSFLGSPNTIRITMHNYVNDEATSLNFLPESSDRPTLKNVDYYVSADK